ncbi:hypothetical protein ACQJBY_024085 [Aegilops geniculata]
MWGRWFPVPWGRRQGLLDWWGQGLGPCAHSRTSTFPVFSPSTNKVSRDSSRCASDLLMTFPGASTPSALASRSILAARGAGAHEAPCVLGGGGDVVPDSGIGSSDPAVGPVLPDVPQLDQGVGLADGEFSGASCKTFSSGCGDVASGSATPAVVSHNSVQSSGCSGPADSCTTFSSGGVVQPTGLATPAVVSHSSVQSSGSSVAAGWCTTFSSEGVVLPSARVGDGTPAVVSSCTVQSARHSGPASANTTIRVG